MGASVVLEKLIIFSSRSLKSFRFISSLTPHRFSPLNEDTTKYQSKRSRLKSHQQNWPKNLPSSSSRSKRGVFGVTDENTRLTEVITIYEKLTKSRDREEEEENDRQEEYVFRSSPTYFNDYYQKNEGLLALGQQLKETPQTKPGVEKSPKVLDFNKFRNILWKNYSYFSAQTGLIQSHTLDGLKWEEEVKSVSSINVLQDSKVLLHESKHFCLNIVNPTDKDLEYLGTNFNVHDLTLRDIQDQSTGEKVEVFKHYTFLSLKPYLEADINNENKYSKSPNDIDLNVLMFPEFTIIIHQGPHWTGLKDMLGFLNLLSSYGSTPLTPDWVIFSIFIELAQDAKFSVRQLEPKIINLRVNDVTEKEKEGKAEDDNELGLMLAKNFENEFQVYKIYRFIKPKIKVLKLLRFKCDHRLPPSVLNLLASTRKEFEEIGEALAQFSHILERSQDTCLTLANVKQSQESNQLGKVMKRISEVALLFLPLQAVAGFLGMNVKIPMQDVTSTLPFWGILFCSSVLCIGLFTFSRRVPAKRNLALRLINNKKGNK